MDDSISYIKLNLFKDNNHNNTFLSKLLVSNLISTDNLKKIRSTSKKLVNNSSNIPYLSYVINNIEYKLFNIIEINKFLDNIHFENKNSSIIYNHMMESKI